MESSCWPESSPFNREKAIGELVQGRHFAFKLKAFLHQSIDIGNQSLPAEDLVLKVLNSFTNTLSMLNRLDSDEVSHFPAASFQLPPPSSDGRKSEDSGDSCRSSSASKDRRGRYKRRKTSHSWTRDSPDLVDDGHAWRKYGQKVILNAKYPRNYYRCTHKFEQGCPASKQVQRIEEDPPLYRTVYNGNHTCKNLLKANNLYIDFNESNNANGPSILLSFNGTNNNQNHPFFTSSFKKEEPLDDNHQPSSSADQAVNNSSSSCTTIDDDQCSFDMGQLDQLMIPSDIDHHQFDDDDDVLDFGVCI